ncbi:hypothetical protein PR202_ga21357 [Eleusine coracana subsp. coracana]|uniref:DUF1618 domain-containing protein n=1 Tax=Eleusine coracana subsp. coracana TaxID=191504 RepID=A0AAV5D0V3_ELECO|nr:hypothetical protein QOZ80_8AG0635550 [Eleusine coracana subsp. coracana]GJN03867.1 hypothetical protein PR202_ga21357 [Eleusine coracana subsp. coracana]
MWHHSGIIFSNVFDESPVLRYVPFPAEAEKPISGLDPCPKVKFVNIFPRCCCGGAGATHCRLSHEAYVITTWTLRMGAMEWVKDGMVDATELWALDAYEGFPRVLPSRPVVSMDDPTTICFFFFRRRSNVNGGGNTVWMAMVHMTRKTLIPSVAHSRCRELWFGSLLPSRVSEFFNSDRSSRTSAASECHKDTAKAPMVIVQEPCKISAGDLVQPPSSMSTVSTPTREESKVSTLEETIFTELEKIPGLLGDDMLKAFSILTMDNRRRFSLLLALPMGLRKDWLLMEIRASEAACSICSACTAHMRCS